MKKKPSNKTYVLRPLEKSDLETILPWFQNVEDLAKFERVSRIPLNLAQTEESWSDMFTGSAIGRRCWFVVENSAGKLVGMSGLEGISPINRDAVVAMFVDHSVRRHGVGIRATALVADFAFRQLGLNRLTSYYRADNVSSRDLVARLGCQIEGSMRQAWFADGQFHDMVVVGLLSSGWFENRNSLAKELGGETIVKLGNNASDCWCWPPQETGSD
ncbi:GNAT family N-acetyltransferase [Ruegeria faecimaris]|uniref:GNAT family N-acetyltransferase n=1 Tax=Ruegeria faecimaris TaxID=686389 RepID=UPI0024910A40|nr:GNAT family protein [Ruegeria faecimaris]